MTLDNNYLVPTTFKTEDCIYLLKDLSNVIKEVSIEEKEKLIASGVNYSEMISKEYPVSDEINHIFETLLNEKKDDLAKYIATITQYLYKQYSNNTILVSLARAGSPVGVLIKRYFNFKYNIDVPHYSISIIRDKGIDENALNYIRKNHPNGNIVFVDGWTGKGSITHELTKAIAQYNNKYNTNISSDLVVLADPAKKSLISGTKKDICIPNACLNSTVSGLVSRTIHNRDLINEKDFHGGKFFGDLKDKDYTNYFIDTIVDCFTNTEYNMDISQDFDYVNNVINKLESDFEILDKTKIKLSIGETSRALLRRKPKIVLVKDINDPELKFILHLAKEKNIEVKEYDTFDYSCIALLQ